MNTPTQIIATVNDPCGTHARILTDRHVVTFYCYQARDNGQIVLHPHRATERRSGFKIGRGHDAAIARARAELASLIASLATVGSVRS